MLDGQSAMRPGEAAMSRSARPQKFRRIINHACTDGIEIDVAVAVKDVAFAIDEARFITSFPQRACAAMTYVELADVLASQFLHKASDGTSC